MLLLSPTMALSPVLLYIVICVTSACDVWESSTETFYYDTNVTRICRYRELTETPTDMPANTHVLDLTLNILTWLDSTQLHHVTGLLVMELDNNQLTTFPDFTFCKDTIEVITARYNQITRLDLSVLASLRALSVLILYDNQLTTVAPLQDGQTLQSIGHINVGYNQLASFPELCQPTHAAYFPKLVIYLTDNPLDCGVCLAWLKECPYDIDIEDYAKPTCALPVDLNGRGFDSLTMEELNRSQCVTTSGESPMISPKTSAMYSRSSVLSGGAVISEGRSSGTTSCAVQCLRLGGESFDYDQDRQHCTVYADQAGLYDEV